MESKVSPVTDSVEAMEPQEANPPGILASSTNTATGALTALSVVGKAQLPQATVGVINPVVLPILTMPAPKTQAPQRLRRIPVVDPSTLIPARRSSTRSIKRKKFDDELVESSLVKTERGRSVKAGGPVLSVASPVAAGLIPTQPQPASAGNLPLHAGIHVTTPAISPAGDAPPAADSIPAHVSASAGSSGDAPVRNAITITAAASAAVPPLTVATAATLTAAASVTQAGAVSAGSNSPFSSSHASAGSGKSGKEQSLKEETDKHSERATAGKLPAEKRSRPSSGKSTSTAPKGGGASKVASSRHVAAKAAGSKSSGSRSGVAKSKSRSKSKRSKKQKTATPAIKDLGRWKPQDDLILITAVQQTNDLSAVHTGVKFSCRFTLKEIEERWYALLYDPAISKIAMEAARQLHSDTVATIQGKALYSNAEEKLLGTVASGSQPSLDTFQSLLQQHPDVFHPARTAKTLQCHWLLMKQYHLLPDQTVQPMPRGDHILNLSDIEDFMNDDDIGEGEDDMVEQELALVDRRNKREIRHLEQELPKWQVLVDSVTGISMPDFDSQTLGVLRGRLVRYLMRSREISLGRRTKDNHVDVDLSLEGPAWKISRRQGIIKLRNSGDFFIANEGKRPIIVDGRPVMCGNKQKLNNNSVVEISCLRFTFLINQDVINSIRADATKPSGASAAAGAT